MRDRPFELDPVDDQERQDRLALFIREFRLPGISALFDAEKRSQIVAARARQVRGTGRLVGQAKHVIARRQVNARFQRDGLVLGRDHVLLQQHPLEVDRIDRDMRSAPSWGFETAQLDAHQVVAGNRHFQKVRRTRLPYKGTARPHIKADFVDPVLETFDTQRAAMSSRPPVYDLAGRLLQGKRFLQRALGRGEVFFDVGRREGQHRPDPLEAVPIRIFRQTGGVGGVVMHAQQIVDGVGVFVAGELLKSHALALGQPGGFAFLEPRGKPVDDLGGFFRRGLRLLFRRHFARTDALHDVAPAHGRTTGNEISGKGVEPEISLLLLLSVTAQAVRLEKG